MPSPQALELLKQYLAEFATRNDFESSIASIFGRGTDAAKLSTIRQQWLAGDFSLIPAIEVLDGGELGTANGAYAAALDKIFVSSDFLAGNQNNQLAIAGLLLEEIGHKLDRVLNGNVDTPGDEGAIFRLVVTGQAVSAEVLAGLRGQDDRSTILLDGRAVAVEKQDFFGDAGGVVTNDNIVGTAGDDNISGLGGNDRLFGDDGNDTVNGGDGSDNLFGGNGNDILNGDAGNDDLNSDAGNDTINGGAGTDSYSADYSDRASGLTMTFDSATGNGTITVGTETDTLTSIENLSSFIGTNFDDTIVGSASGDLVMRGGAGNDTISGNDGNDRLFGDDGNDTVNGGDGSDNLFGGNGNDILNGDAGNDDLNSDAGNDTINGGAGTDSYSADYSDRASGLTMTFDSATGNGTITVGTETDTLTSIENLNFFTGTNFDDTIVGSASRDFAMRGGAGNDTISGNGGDDYLLGDDGNDTVNGGDGNDDLFGGNGNDILNGDAGNDDLNSDAGNDTINGGDGTDRYSANYSDRLSGLTMTFDSATGNGTITVGTETDTLTSIENLNFFTGTNFDDTIVGSASGDLVMRGGAGNDTISGNDGNDRLLGDDGNDTVNGGDGSDNLFGGNGNDILNGVNSNSLNPGIGQQDNLTGESGSDLFILGDSANVYYDDRNASTTGSADYATITDLNTIEDKIQLKGIASDYRLELNTRGTATNLYVDKAGTEPDELIAVLENISGLTSNSSVFVYVQPNSALQFSAANFRVNENGNTVIPVVITRSGNNQGAVSVTVNPSNGTATATTDYNSAPIVVNFADGETSKTVNLPIVNDVLQEGNETVSLTLSNPTGGATLGTQTTAILTIVDDDVLVPDSAGNSLSTARDIGLLNGTQSFNDFVDAVDNNDFYRFELLKNSTFNLTLDGLTANANVELIGKDGIVISNSIASGTTTENISQTLNAGVYYLRVYPQSGQTNYNLTVKGTPLPTPFQINSVSPDKGSNAGQVTLTLKGNQFTTAAAVTIIAPDDITRNATNVIWQDESTLIATFDLNGLGEGAYDVKVSDTAGTAQKNDIFKVDTAGQGQLDASINVTARLRPWNIGEVTVNYKNTGNTDIPTPLFSLNLLSQSGLAKFIGTDPKIFTQKILGAPSGGGGGASTIDLSTLKVADSETFYGSGNIGDPSTLSPGESGSYKIYFSPAPTLGSSGGGGGGGGVLLGAEKAVGGISFSLKVLPSGNNNSGTIDWTKLKDSSKPSNISTEAWDVIYNNFTTALGNTSASYQKNLAENSSYIGRLGGKTDDVSRLLAFELQQADNALGRRVLASNVDAAAPTPGLLLTFDRVYRQPISSRFALGDLGRGWTHNWDTIATTATDGNVTIRSGGSIRSFEKRSDNSYRAQDGDYATLKLQNGAYRLEEQGGLARVFQGDGKLSYVEDPNGNRITLGYTGTQLTTLTHSNGDKFTLGYNSQGRIATLTDQAGRLTTYTYDGTGEILLSATRPDGTTNYSYESNTAGAKAFALKQVKLPDNTSNSFDYDDRGRLIQQRVEGDRESATYTYDSTGGIIVKDGTGANAKILLNDNGQTAQSEDALGRITQFSYDDTGNLTKVVAPGNSISNFTYDRQGNILGSTDPLGQRVDFSYESKFNNLSTVKDQRGNITAYAYTDKGNLSNITYVDGTTETYNYDAIGNLTVSANRRGQKIDYTYDTKGQLLSKKYPDGTSATFTYDSRGNLLTAVDADSTIAYSYDTANRLTKATQNNGRFVEYTYDAGGRRTKMLDHTGAAVNYSYDAAGRLSQLTDGNNLNIITYTYDAAGRLNREDNGNGTYTTYTYDAAGQVTGILNYTASNAVNSKYEYTYDNLGRRSSMTTLEGTTSYGYDATGQLIAVTLADGRKIEYAYDAAGNRTTVKDSGTTTNYNTNNLNQYTQVGSDNYTYDADGNLIGKTQGGKTFTYTYDIENRLTQVVSTDGTWNYEYDALGNRIASIKDGQRTEYLLDPTGLSDVVGDYNSTGDLVARYTHGIGLVSRTDSSNTRSYYDTDAIGSVVGLSGTTGSYLNRYSYLPFGEDLTKVETVANPFEYVGQFGVMDEGNGLDFMRARFYDSNLGRFTAVDPIGLKGTDTNLYRYVFNNPINLIDSLGSTATPPKNMYELGFPTNDLPPTWIPYNGRSLPFGQTTDSTVFHGNAVGFVENRIPSWRDRLSGNPQGEAFYDRNTGNLIPSGTPTSGTPNYFDPTTGIGGSLGHGVFDVGSFWLDKLIDRLSDAANSLYDDISNSFNSLENSLLNAWNDILDFLDGAIAQVLLAFDPNDITGPAGFGTQNYIAPDQTFPYAIRFENQASATAPAVFVTVTQQVDEDLDLSTFELGDFGFGNIYIDVPEGLKAYSTRVDLTSTIGYFVDFNAALDPTTRNITWKLTTIDPITGGLPTNPDAGFLPPNNANRDGEGFINYSIKPKANLPTGTTIDAKAKIVFDFNAPIDTPTWTNTIDVDPPTSKVVALPNTNSPEFTVTWAGEDKGSGIATYDVYVSVDGGAYTLWQDNTNKTSGTYTGVVGKTYSFYSVATDNIGRTEVKTATAETTTKLVDPIPTISISATDSEAAETKTAEIANPGKFTLTRTGITTAELTVNYTISGTATNETDYTKLTGTVTFKVGEDKAVIDVNPIDDNIFEGNETVSIALTEEATKYKLDPNKSASLTIADNETKPTISISSANPASGKEGDPTAKDRAFTIDLSNPSTEIVSVDYSTLDGTAIAGSDYTTTTGTIKFNPSETSKTVNVSIVDDAIFEDTETFKIKLTNPTNGTLTQSESTVTIIDDDLPAISLVVTDSEAAETKSGKPTNPGKFTLQRTGITTNPLTVKYTLAGSATNGKDYQTLEQTITFAAGSNTASIDLNIIDDKIYEGNETVILKLAESSDYTIAGENNGTISIADNDPQIPKLFQSIKNFLEIDGGTEKLFLKFTKLAFDSAGKNEICAFTVDDERGLINGIKPGENGYLAAALDRSQVVFSTLGNNPIDRQFDLDTERYLPFNPGDRVQLLLIADDTLDRVKIDPAAAKVLFSIPDANASNSNQSEFIELPNDGGYQIAWEDTPNDGEGRGDRDFNDLVVKVKAIDNFTPIIGTGLQNQAEGCAIDLRSLSGQNLKVDTNATGDAAYQNYIGFYSVTDDRGTLANGLKPGDAGYTQAAIESAILRSFKTETKTDRTVTGGSIFAPVVIANGTFEQFLNGNAQNQANGNIHAYFNYSQANPDKLDHFRLLGDNKFGVEDLLGGGDRDYNDIIFQMNVRG